MPRSAQLLGVLDVTRYVFGRTGRRERARQSEDHHALARRLLAHAEAVRPQRAARPLVFDKLEERRVGQLFTCLNHAQSFASMRSTLARRRVAVKFQRSPHMTAPPSGDSRPFRFVNPKRALVLAANLTIRGLFAVHPPRSCIRPPALHASTPAQATKACPCAQSACLRRNAGMSYVSTPFSCSACTCEAAVSRDVRHTAGVSSAP